MSLAAIRSQIKIILESVPSVGTVYDYLRWDEDWKGFFNLFNSSRGWMITRVSTVEDRELAHNLNTRIHTFQIIGFMFLKDEAASEKTFQNLIETICDTFRANPTLNNTALDSDPLEVTLVENRIFGSIVVHYTQLTLRVKERFQYA